MGGGVVKMLALLVMANVVFASVSPDESEEECIGQCSPACFQVGIVDPECLKACQRLCSGCAPNCKNELSLTQYCGVGCSLGCAKFKDSNLLGSCLDQCTNVHCKI